MLRLRSRRHEKRNPEPLLRGRIQSFRQVAAQFQGHQTVHDRPQSHCDGRRLVHDFAGGDRRVHRVGQRCEVVQGLLSGRVVGLAPGNRPREQYGVQVWVAHGELPVGQPQPVQVVNRVVGALDSGQLLPEPPGRLQVDEHRYSASGARRRT